MTHQQFKAILDKVKTHSDIRFRIGRDRVEEIFVAWDNGVSIKIYQGVNYVDVTIMNDSVNKRNKASMAFPGKLLRLFNISWWRWTLLCRKIRKDYKKQQKLDSIIEKQKRNEQFDEAIVEAFPDILEDQIFGDD